MNARTILSFVTPSTRLAAGLFGALIACLSLFSTPAYAADDWDVIRVTGYRYANTPSGGGIQYALGRYAEQITLNRADVFRGRRGSASESEQRDPQDRCKAEADIEYADCKYRVLEWYSQDLNSCDRAFPRRTRGWSIGIQGIFGLDFRSSSELCREDRRELRDQNLHKCGKWLAEDIYACRTS